MQQSLFTEPKFKNAPDIEKGAIFSPRQTWRYSLWRIWNFELPYCMFICLNPSTADEINDDPTVTRCINFAQSWGYGALCMTNLFAFRATKPPDMKRAWDPIGPKNNEWLRMLSKKAGIIVGAWGNDGLFANRAEDVCKIIKNIHCLDVTEKGQPWHPLYLKSTLKPVKYEYKCK